jgi:hypothetical protein
MRKSILILSALALSAGVASADRSHGGDRGDRGGDRGERRGPVVQQHWNGGNRGWSGGVNVSPNRDRHYDNRRPVIVNASPRYRSYERPVYVQHRPIYVQRPTIRYRYYNYDQRPQILAENYAPMAGYYWVAGAWNWDGYEWNWQAGHYEPDPQYSGYDDGSYNYDGNYNYDSSYYQGY